MELNRTKKTLVYALHSGNLYGTEQMALATCDGLRDEFDCHIFAPEGLAIAEAKRMNFKTRAFAGARDFTKKLRPILQANDEVFFIATGLVHSLALIVLNLFYQCKITHLHVVHGGTDERLSYGRKKYLNFFSVTFVAVSEFVKERLIAHRVRENKIKVIENFLTSERIENCPKRPAFFSTGIKKVSVISRVDPIKRIDVLLDTLDKNPKLSSLQFTVYGTGSEFETLKNRAAENHKNVCFAGFHSNVAVELAKADLLLHLCPEEPFGLAIIEAFAAGVPVLVPDSGGAGSLVVSGVDGFRFRANDAEHLGIRLYELTYAPAEFLNSVVRVGRRTLGTRFSAAKRLEDYRRLLNFEEPQASLCVQKTI